MALPSATSWWAGGTDGEAHNLTSLPPWTKQVSHAQDDDKFRRTANVITTASTSTTTSHANGMFFLTTKM